MASTLVVTLYSPDLSLTNQTTLWLADLEAVAELLNFDPVSATLNDIGNLVNISNEIV
jgi:hypothetical protein